jgi:hypothetical protein
LCLLCLGLGISSISPAQTKGLIVKAATSGGAAVLDPNGDGYVSKTTTGFLANDVAESEIIYIKMDLPIDDPLADTRTGPTDGFTDFVGNGNIYSAASYYDGTNMLFRFRLGGFANNAKGYSVLIDTDGKFGNTGSNADPEYSSVNPGFEVEVVLRTNFFVDVNNVNTSSTGSPIVSTTSFAYDQYSQKAVAYTTNNGTADYFYDFYVPFSALTGLGLGITTATPLRMVPNTVISPKSALVGNISDIGGVNDGITGITSGWTTIINAQSPTSADGTVQSEPPVVTGPITDGATSVSGTSTEANGTTITVYKNGVPVGTTTVSGGTWTLSGLTALVSGQVITATAQASGELVSVYSESVTVSCSYGVTAPAGFAITVAASKVVQVNNTDNSFATNGVVNLYRASAGTDIILTNAGFTTLTVPSTGQATNQYCWKCDTGGGSGGNTCTTSMGNNCTAAAGSYWATYKAPSAGCHSVVTAPFCVSGTATTYTALSVTSPIAVGATTISGAITANALATGGTGTYRIYLFVGLSTPTPEVYLGSGTVVVSSTGVSTPWSVTLSDGSSVISGKRIIAYVEKVAVGTCFSAAAVSSSNIATASPSDTPVVNSTIIAGATSISGTSTEANGTTIRVYKNGVLLGTTTVSGGTWTLGSLSGLVAGDVITATAQNTTASETVSATSSSVTVIATQTAVTPSITGSYFEGGTSVSGGFSAGTVNAGDILKVYIDGVQLNDASGNAISLTLTAGQTSWTLSSIGSTELYPGGVLSAKVTRTGNSEGPSSNTVTVQCTNPDLSTESLTATTPSVCNNTTATVQVANSDSGVIYTLYDAANTTALSSDRLGTGGTITFSTFNLTADVSSFTLRAFKIPNTSCATNALKTLPTQITIYANPLDRTVSPTSQTVNVGAAGSITVASSESGVSYQLWKDLTTDVLVSSQTGTGGTLTFGTGALGVATTFYIKAIRTHTAPDPDLLCELVMSQNATVNVNNDADGDGVNNLIDLDDDNDGIPDIVEGKGVNPSLDADGDGIPNFLDSDFPGFIDTNADGVDDRFDQDLDGIPNHLDLDSDNDGIPDVIEAGGIDTNGDGRVDFTEADANAADADNDGLIDNIDAGNADSAASSELTNGSYGGIYPVGGAIDTDADGVPDFLDLDSDNDGIFDVLEAGGTDANNDGIIDYTGTFASNDSNGNGWINSKDGGSGGTSPITTTGAVGTVPTAYIGQNTDGDAVPDFRDLDSDNDGINDVLEAGLTDSDNNGLIGTGSGASITGLNTTTGVVTGATSTVLNTDGDAVPDFRDLDSDNDGINDVRENGGTDANNDGLVDGTDADGDGILSSADGNLGGFGDMNDPLPTDTDGDGVPNYRDLDSDNDGINDVRENGGTDANNDGLVDGTDADGDGILSSADGNLGGFGDTNDPLPTDTDVDGVPNYRDLDSDNDGINDVIEYQDTNGNGIIDGAEINLDTNNDGLVDGTDTDGDGILGLADGNTSGFGDASDPAPASTDGDSVPNYLDLDSDGDGINDIDEVCAIPSPGCSTLDADDDGVVDGNTDADGDGILAPADANDNTFGEGTGSLPVTFVSFNGQLINNQVKLDWKTISERNNSYFIIERSLNTQNWTEIIKVTAKGEAQTLTSYQAFDENPQVGTNYYRLWQVDKDGKREMYPRWVDIVYNYSAINSIYPNPTIDKLNIKLKSNPKEPVQLRIINASGKVLQEIRFQKTAIEDEVVLNVKDLPNGIYFLEILSVKGRETLKFVK